MYYFLVFFLLLLLISLFLYTYKKYTSRKLCILMYHRIGDTDNPEEGPYYVSADVFSGQIDLMLEKGYTPISLSELEDAFERKAELPPRAVMITLDDGWEDNYINAYPILKEKKVPVTIFLSAAQVGVTDGILNWEQIHEMRENAPVQFSSHGANHKRLRDLSDEEALAELTVSKQIIEEHTAAPVKTFCYPYGAFDRRVRSLVFKAGYTIDIGTRKGLNCLPLKKSTPLRRAHVLNNERMEDFYNELRKGRK